jgi:PAS domain S-box-containing protein
LRFSLQNTQLPAVKAALGQEGIVEGVDYRDVPVLADVRAAPNSPWYLVTKMDTAEVYAPLQERLWQTVGFFGALIATAGTALGLIWRHQRARYYRELAVAERARRVSEREYQVLVQNIPGMVYRAGSDWKTKIASGAESLCGYTGDEINSMPRGWLNIIHPDDRDAVERVSVLLTREHRAFVQLYRIIAKNGQTQWIEDHKVALFSELGIFEGVDGIAMNITERKRAEEALQAERDLMQSVINGAGNSHLVYLDRDFNFVMVNETYAARCGYRPEEMIGKNHFVLYPHEENESIFRHARDTGEPFSIRDKPFDYPDQPGRGTTYWDWTLTPVKDREGWVSGLIFSLFETTERKRAEEELRQSEETYRSLLTNLNAGVVVHAPDTKVLIANPMACSLLGLSEDQIMGKEAVDPCWRFLRDDGSDMPLDEYPVNQVLAAASPLRNLVVGVRRSKADDVVWVLVNGFAAINDAHQIEQVIISFVDITERKRVEEALKASEEWLAETAKIARVGGFVVDRDGRTQTWTEETFRIYELPPGKAPDMTEAILFYHPEDRPGVSAAAQRVVERAENVAFEARLITAKKNLIWVHVIAYPVFSEGCPVGVRGSIQDVTERKQAEEALKASELKYQQLVENTADWVWMIDLENVHTYSNQAVFAMLGYHVDEVVGESAFPVMHPEDAPQIKEMLQNAIEHRTGWRDVPIRWLRKDGAVRFIESTATPVFNDDGRMIGMSGIDRDITDRKRAEEELQETKRRLADTIQFLPDATLAIDRDKRITVWNKAIEEMTGIPATEMIGQGNYAYTVPFYGERRPQLMDLIFEDSAETAARYPAITRQGDMLTTEVFCNALYSGKGAWVFAKASPLYDASGKIIGAIESIRDITEHRRAEASLRQERERLAGILRGTNAGAWEWNVQTGETIFNERWAEIIGYTLDEISPVSIETWMKFAHPDDLKTSDELLQKHFSGDLDYYECEARMRHKSGEWVWVLDRGRVTTWTDDGKPLMMMGTHQDITERKRAEEALRESEVRFSTIFHASPGAIAITRMEDNRLADVNEAYQNLTGYTHAEAIGHTVYELNLWVVPEERERMIKTLREQGTVRDLEIQIRQKSGKIRQILFSAELIELAGERYLLTLAQDLTERKRAEEALQRARDELEARVIERTRELNRRIAQVETLNAATTNLLQDLRAANQVQQQTNQELARLHEQLRAQRVAEQAALLQLSQALLGETDSQKIMDLAVREAAAALMVEIASLSLLEEDGEHISIRASLGWAPEQAQRVNHVPLAESGNTSQVIRNRTPIIRRGTVGEMLPPLPDMASQVGIVATAVAPLLLGDNSVGTLAVGSRTPRDWTDDDVRLLSLVASTTAQALERARLFEQINAGRKRFEDLAHRLVEMQESERRYIARELHDEIGQMLTGLKLLLTSDVDALPGRTLANVGEARTLVGDLMARVRNLSLDLRPAMLDDLGLLPAVVWFIGRYETQTEGRVAFNHLGIEGERFPREVETTAYRIVQEALTNVARHAGVKSASVRLWARGEVLEVQVEDTGSGFDPATALAAGKSSGLAGMRERAVLLGGQLTIDSAPGAGTRLIAVLPLSDRVERRSNVRLNPARG